MIQCETKRCVKCGEEKPLNKFRIRQSLTGKLNVDNLCLACKGKVYTAKVKLRMLKEFGGKCNCCGETHPQFLSLEHIQGSAPYCLGRKAGRKSTSTYQLIRMAECDGWDRTRYELLCFNCNLAKGFFGQCPHRTGITAEQFIASLEEKTKGIGRSHRNALGGESTRMKPGFDIRRPNQRKLAEAIKEYE